MPDQALLDLLGSMPRHRDPGAPALSHPDVFGAQAAPDALKRELLMKLLGAMPRRREPAPQLSSPDVFALPSYLQGGR